MTSSSPLVHDASRRAILIASLATVCVLSAACAAGRPVHYYTIDPPALTTVAPKPNGPSLVVGRFTAPETLEDGRIRYRSGSHEVGSYEYHRWTEPPGMLARDLLIRTLRGSGNYCQVQEASGTASGDYLVRGRLLDFSEVDSPGIRIRVALQLELFDRKTGALIWTRDYGRDEAVEGKTMKDVVAAMDHGLQQVVAEAASGIGAFLSTRS